MNRSIFTFLLLLTLNMAFGQSLMKHGRKHATPSTAEGVLDISGSIQSNNYYVAGQTMDLLFTFDVMASDYEYVDSLALTFPTGIVPIASLDSFPGNGDGQPAEYFNPIDGQIISWGNNDNDYGGIGTPGTYSFFVTVVIDTNVVGDQSVSYFASGDEYAGSIHDFSGNFTIQALPDSADLTVFPSGFAAEYYEVPLSQATFSPSAFVKNHGSELTAPVNVDLTITGGYTSTQPLPNPMGYLVGQNLAFSNFTATDTGTYTFDYNINYLPDFNQDDNTAATNLVVNNNMLIRDNGDVIDFIGIESAGGEIGEIFTITTQDTLTALSFVLDPTVDNIGTTLTTKIRSITAGKPDAEIGVGTPVTITEDTAYNVKLLIPTVLAPGTYFIGLVEGAGNMQLAYTSTPFTTNSAWAYFDDKWNNLQDLGFKHTYVLRAIFDTVPPVNNDIQLVSVNTNQTILQGDFDVSGRIQNLSTGTPLTSFDVAYSADGVTSDTFSISGISINSGAFYDFTHNVPFAATAGFHTIEVVVFNPNEEADESPENNSITSELIAVNEVFPQVVVGEEATGTWCGWCVRGHVALKDLAHNITDGSWIGIAVHNDDPMANTEYDSSLGEYTPSGYPNGIINRIPVEIDPADFQTAYDFVVTNIPFAKVEITSAEMDSETRDLTVDASSIFAMDIQNANYKLSMVVIEDGVTGTASGYNQVNYYAANELPITDWEGIDWSTLANPIPATDMIYDHVGRYIVGGFTGATGSVPNSVTYSTPNSYQFTTSLPAEYDEEEISVAVFLLDVETGQIVNATEKKIDIVVSNTKIGDSNTVQIAPNPTSGQVTIEGEAGSTITVFDLLGRLVLSEEMPSAKHTIDLSSLENGSYWVEILNNNTLYSKKVILNK